MRTFRALGSIGVATTAALLLAGCSASSPSGSPSFDGSASSLRGQTITVYNAQHAELTSAWAAAFTKKTGVKVIERDGDDTSMANQIVQEGKASPADVFLTENSPAMTVVAKAGLFTKVDSSTLATVESNHKPSDGLWTGIAARSTVLVYNPKLISAAQLPKSMADLASSTWKGRWGAAPSGADFQAIVSAYLDLNGKAKTLAWLQAMKTNAKVYQSNTAAMTAVNAGQVPAAVIYHYYWYGDQAAGGTNSSNTKLYFFKNQDAGAFLSTSGGGMLASSKHQQAAQAFLAFIDSAAGQGILKTGTSFEYPVASGVAANSALPSLASLQAPSVDPSKLNSKEVTDLMTQAGLL